MTAVPEACGACLRRAWLLADLSGRIESAVDSAPGRRAPELLALEDDELAAALGGSGARRIASRSRAREGESLRSRLAAAGLWAVCRHHRAYPPALEGAPQAPAVLFGRGDPSRLAALGAGEHSVCVVGARRPSSYGSRLAEELARELAAAGLVVVSGMAMGIDSRAHAGALRGGGLTVAVLGSGADRPYPARARALYERIAERGLVLSELPPGVEARRWTFPARNRIMAALAAMTVVVEARERSGSLITATMAGELGREVGAVPGRVGNSTAAGANALLRDGAQVVRGAQDVLDSLLGAGALRSPVELRPAAGPGLDRELAAVLEAVERGASTPDAVALAGEMSASAAAAGLARLELLGYLSASPAGRFERTPLRAPDPAEGGSA